MFHWTIQPWTAYFSFALCILVCKTSTADYLLTLRNAYFDAGINRIVRLSDSGTVLGDVLPATEVIASGLSGPTGMQISPGGQLIVASTFGNQLLEFQVQLGSYVGRLSPNNNFPPTPALDGPAALVRNASGDLLVANLGEAQTGFMGTTVSKIDPSTGDSLGNFGSGHQGAAGILIDGDATYVSEFSANQVLRFDSSGVLQETISDPMISGPTGLALDPTTGNLLIASVNGDRIVQYDGAVVSSYVATPTQFFPSGVYFVNQNEYLVTSAAVGSILKYTVGNPIPAPWVDYNSFGLTLNDLLNGVAIGDMLPFDGCDLDLNGQCDLTDVDGLVAEIAAGHDPSWYDLTGDGLVAADDLMEWLADAGRKNLVNHPSYLPGDANLDGAVDVSDLNLWNAAKFQATAAWSQGDFNADGQSNVADFDIWNKYKFQTSFTAVPEPTGAYFLWLTFAALVGADRQRGRHRQRNQRDLPAWG